MRKSNYQAALCHQDQLHGLLSFLDIFVLYVESEWCQHLALPDGPEDHLALIHQIEVRLIKNKHLGGQLAIITNNPSWKRYWGKIQDILARRATTSEDWRCTRMCYG